MKEWFKDTAFHTKTLRIIEQANEIIEEYEADGLTLTLRQLYYQFVARDLLPNKQQSYDNLGEIVSNARLAGLIDWEAIEDRTRFIRGLTHWDDPGERVRDAIRTYAIDMWEGQDARPEVWIEKDALVGVIERVCVENDTDFFACRGYVSQSELYSAGKRIQDRYYATGQRTVVIHLGDHDPSGIDMTRDNEERLVMFAGDPDAVEVRRIAINLDQVRRYSPPPNPAKLTDNRAPEYIARFGRSSWELDALEPRVIRDLIQTEIDTIKDTDLYEDRERVLREHRKIMREVAEIATKRSEEL